MKVTWFYIESPGVPKNLYWSITPIMAKDLITVIAALRDGMNVTLVPDRMPFDVIDGVHGGRWR